MTDIQSTDDQRTENTLRHKYRVLDEREKQTMDDIKDKGQELFDLIEHLGHSREYSLAKTKVEEAVMWAVKGLTA